MIRRRGIAFLFGLVLIIIVTGSWLSGGAVATESTGTTTLVSINSAGVQGNHISDWPSISTDGRFVAFSSDSSNLIPNDINNYLDVYVHDRQTGETTIVSVDSSGTQTTIGGSHFPSISGDGQFVAFMSGSSEFVPDDNNNSGDIFVRDRYANITSRVSVSTSGQEGNYQSLYPSISADGRYVTFYSEAFNLVPDDNNNSGDIFVHDRQTSVTTMVSINSDGDQGNDYSLFPVISADGRFVVYESVATNLVPGDTNNVRDVFIYDRQASTTTRVSVNSFGVEGNSVSGTTDISADGRFIVFSSSSTNLISEDSSGFRVFVHDRLAGKTSLVSNRPPGTDVSYYADSASISADGRFVAYRIGPIVVPSENDVFIFLHDGETNSTTVIAQGSVGELGNTAPGNPDISAGGRYVAFDSSASNLVPGDTNGVSDVFVHDRGAGTGSLLGETTVMPFLALPFSLTAGDPDPLLNWNLGRVRSWFDHSKPNYQVDGNLHLYDSAINVSVQKGAVDGRPCYAASETAPNYCYEGHDGIDFRPNIRGANQPVLAAAAGKVVGVTPDCQANNSCTGLGNNVILFHFQGYFTRYGHLQGMDVTVGQQVNSGDQIGTMGSTGNSTGVHLHFAVYRDVNDDEQFDSGDKVVDPFGYKWPGGPESDPWVVGGGSPSYLLWLSKAPRGILYSNEEGANISNATETVTITIPPGTFPGGLNLRLDDTQPIAVPSAGLRSGGKSFWLRFIEWLEPDDAPVSTLKSDSSPISISVNYPASTMAHLEEQEVKLVRWDEVASKWLVLPTTVDTANHSLIGEATEMGHFDIQAPLICPADVTEPDDDPLGAIVLATEIQSAERLFDIPADEDWFSFGAVAGTAYRFDLIRDSGVVAALELLDEGQNTLQTGASGLVWTAPSTSWYYVRVTPDAGSLVGCDAGYSLLLQTDSTPSLFKLYLPVITGSVQ